MVTGLTEEVVSNTDEALVLLESGNAVRVTLATDMNAHSSRSHVIFTLILGKYARVYTLTFTLGSR